MTGRQKNPVSISRKQNITRISGKCWQKKKIILMPVQFLLRIIPMRSCTAAMQLGKHVYTQKPLTHDIYEARILTEAAKKYKVVTQMGNQGGSGDGVRKAKEMVDAGMIGDVHTVHAGPTVLYGHKAFQHQPESLIFQRNWIGIFGLVLQKRLISILLIFHLTGVDGGHLVPVHWVIWPVISWIPFTGYCRLIIPIQR